MAHFVKINDTLYHAMSRTIDHDKDWNNRESRTIMLEMTSEEALTLFVDGVEWSIISKTASGEVIETIDCSDYTMAGPVSDNRDGTVTVKMGKFKDSEILAELLEVLNR